jgi:hypothetical protein
MSKFMELDNKLVNLNNKEKLSLVLSNKDKRETVKTSCAILKERNNLLYK